MNEKTGRKETSAAIILFSLSPAVLYLTANRCSALNAGAWINFIINSGYVFALIFAIHRYFNCYDENIIDAAAKVLGKKSALFIGYIYFVLIFAYTIFNSDLYTESISKLGFFSYSADYISALPVVVSVICAYYGIESNTRFSYVIFFLTLAITLFCVFSTYKAWDIENMYPVFGTSGKTTFFSFGSLAAYPGLSALFLTNGHISRKYNAGPVILRCFGGVFLFGFILTVIYILCVPCPANINFEFTSEGLFSSTLSGEVFHRFEIFLISLNILFDICTTSFGILLSALTLSRLTNAREYKPFVLIIGVMIFYSGFFEISATQYIRFCMAMTGIGFLIPLAIILASKAKRRENETIL